MKDVNSNRKHRLLITGFTFGRIIAECECGKWAEQYELGITDQENFKLDKQVKKDFRKHTKYKNMILKDPKSKEPFIEFNLEHEVDKLVNSRRFSMNVIGLFIDIRALKLENADQ